MMKSKQKHHIQGNGFVILLLFLLLYILGSPFLSPFPHLSIIAHISLSMALFMAVYTVRKERQQRSIAYFILLLLLVLYWLGIYEVIQFTILGAYVLFVLYYGLLVYSYVHQLKHFQKVTTNVLCASFCLYLIIGLFWGSLYTLLNHLSPGSYSGDLLENATGETLHTFNYFSMVTLTTLGYGDITPQTPGAGALCQMEAIVGQFFTAVLVAALMGMYIQENQKQKEAAEKE